MAEIRTVRDLRRSQIIAAARALVAEGGLEALTIGSLERRLEFTRGVITYHFRDKSEIVAAVLESAIDEVDTATLAHVGASGSMEEKIRAVLATKVNGFLAHHEARAILVSFWSRIPADADATSLNSRLYGGWRKQAAALVRAGQIDGSFRGDVSPERIAALLVGMVVGIVVQVAFEPDSVDADELIDEAASLFVARLRP